MRDKGVVVPRATELWHTFGRAGTFSGKRQDSLSGKEYSIEGSGEFVRAQIFVAGNWLLCASVTSRAIGDLRGEKADQFFASFKVRNVAASAPVPH